MAAKDVKFSRDARERILRGVDISPIPEPGTYALMAGGLAVIGWRARRRCRKA